MDGRGGFEPDAATDTDSHIHADVVVCEEHIVSKGMNQKREQLKKPAKTLQEKRAAKKAKKADRAAATRFL